MRSGWLRGVLAACALLGMASCGGSSKTGYVYLASGGTDPGTLTAYRLDLGHGTLNSTNGALVPTGKSVATGTQPGPMIFDSTNKFAFVADYGNPLVTGTDNTKKNGDVTAFSVGKGGALGSIGLTALPAYVTQTLDLTDCATLSPVALALDSQAKFLFVAAQAFFNANGSATCAKPNGTRAPGVLVVFGVASGQLTPISVNDIPVPPAAAGTNDALPSAVAVSNQGSFVYVTDQNNNTVVGFAYDANGALTPIPEQFGLFVTVGTLPQMVFSPAVGNFLYVGNGGTNDIYQFTINSDGSLVPVIGTPILGTGVGPIAMLTDPNVKYAYVLANGGSQVLAYTLNHVTGILSAVGPSGGAVSTGANPVAFTIVSDGTTDGNLWLFTSNHGASTISSFAVNGSTGSLAALPQLTGPVAPWGVVAH